MALKDQIGTFSWFSLMTSDVSSATTFYTELLGWTVKEYEIPGFGKSPIFVASGKEFSGPVPFDNKNNIPSHWISYITVENVEEAGQRNERLGGKICVPPFDIPTIGRTAVFTDPVGTAFHVFTPEDKEADLKIMGNEPGQVCWVELMLDDPSAVLPYYSEMFGWKVSDPVPMGGGAYYSLDIAGEKHGGIMKRPPDVPEMPPAWMPYMYVKSIDETSQKIAGLGGKILLPKTAIPETGYFSLVEDPTGAHFYLFDFTS